MTVPVPNHVHRAAFDHVSDGDTAVFLVDEDFRDAAFVRIRLKGINSMELHDPDPQKRAAALASKKWLEKWFEDTAVMVRGIRFPYIIESHRGAGWDRWEGVVWVDGGVESLNDQIVAAGMAVVVP